MSDSNFPRFALSSMWRWLLLAGLFLLWFGTLQYRALIHPDEGRYAEIAREMAQSGDFITPRLNGIKYFEKPALQYWITAAAFSVFGNVEWAARLWGALCGIIGILFTGYTAQKLWGERAGWFAASILAGSFWWIGNGHFNSLDMGVSCWMAVGLCALLLAQQVGITNSSRRRWMLLTWVAMALSVLSKGLIGIVLPGAVLVLYTLWQRDWRLWKNLELVLGLIVFFLVSAPWFVLVSIKNPEFAHFFFIHEHFERWATTEHRRVGAWWYFFPILAIGFMPWITLLPQTIWRGIRSAPGFSPERMLLVWVIFIFAFFSKSGSKLPSYILPIFPALALLAARALLEMPATRIKWHSLGAVLFGIILIPLAYKIAGRIDENTPAAIYQGFSDWVIAAGIVLIVFGSFAWWAAYRSKPDASIVLLSLSMLIAGQLVMLGHNDFNRVQSGKQLAAALIADHAGSSTIYALRNYDQTIPFYLGRTLTFVDYLDEFEFGMQQEPDKRSLDIDAFRTRWAGKDRAYAVMSDDDYASLKTSGLGMIIIYEDARRVAVRNH